MAAQVRFPAMWDPIPPADPCSAEWRAWADTHTVARTVGLRCTASSRGEVTCALADTPLPNPNGAVHGGVLAAVLDQVLALASLTCMDDRLPHTTNMQVQYLRPAFTPLKIRATVAKSGHALVFVRAEITDQQGRLCTTGDGTF